MCYAVEIELPAGHMCRFYLEDDYFHEYDALPGRRVLSSEEKNKQRERDKDLFLSDYYADYDWGHTAGVTLNSRFKICCGYSNKLARLRMSGRRRTTPSLRPC